MQRSRFYYTGALLLGDPVDKAMCLEPGDDKTICLPQVGDKNQPCCHTWVSFSVLVFGHPQQHLHGQHRMVTTQSQQASQSLHGKQHTSSQKPIFDD
mmetsp:Transcript_16871/g.47106  ORF Transcript_16871/g.47106 Transcript_16871/m.47106 type:complete len:97 (+) Transcript_16871:451-741(+)